MSSNIIKDTWQDGILGKSMVITAFFTILGIVVITFSIPIGLICDVELGLKVFAVSWLLSVFFLVWFWLFFMIKDLIDE